MQDIKSYILGYLPHFEALGVAILKALLIIVLGYYVARFVSKKVCVAVGKKDEILARFISQVIFVVAIIVVIIAALGTIGVQTNSIIAVLSTAGVAIALGLKDSLSSVASGIILIVRRPFKQGDLIEVSGLIGQVEGINLFTTNIRLRDGKFAIIPNSNMATANIINTTYNDQQRIELIIGVGYESDIESVKQIIADILKSTPEVDLSQPYFIGLTELGASSLNFTLRFWIKLEYGTINAQSKVLESIKKSFDEHHIEIPYNRLDVSLIKA
ncbi:mechanosensitive ion channel [Helicobacter jaachi]|uniref:Mechanosensitive ion channel n=1 Tax=Helicobacter jaachi TaxID=1677920 RepID=A0A4U8TDM9_9HELI|nr:mechanosensitive ion channel domain-containing protein [Helicobacter jaachi]TLD97784.1 mechanosensitive ion channel [Helicobacter jaachi]